MEAKDRVKEIRQTLKMTQTEFAEQLGMKWFKVKDLESGRLKITEDIARKMNRNCGISYKWVLWGEEPKMLPYQDGDILASIDAGQFIDLYDADMSDKLTQAVAQTGASPSTDLKSTIDELASSEIVMKVRFTKMSLLADVFKRADGHCELCHNEAPFRRVSNNMPYLEAHHITPIALGGTDDLDNLLALCPNCHKKLHYG
ncbi:MAG: HNH endonuclease [Desulfuromonadaceae bacterium]